MSLRTKIIIPLLILAVTSVTAYVYLIFVLAHNQREIDNTYEKIQKVNNISSEILNLYSESHNILLRYIFTKDTGQLSDIAQNEISTRILTGEMVNTVETKLGHEYLSNFISDNSKLDQSREKLILAVREGDEIQISKYLEIIEVLYTNGNANLTDLSNLNTNTLWETSQLYEALIRRQIVMLFMLILITMILLLTSYFYLKRNITTPVNKLSFFAQNIMEKNYAYENVKHESNDELGLLAKNLEKMSKVIKSQYDRLEREIVRKEIEIQRNKEFEEQKDNFISIASHELKTPITSLKIYNQLMLKTLKNAPNSEYEKYLTKTDSQINKMTMLISELLDMTKIQKGKMNYNFKEFDLNTIVSDAIEIAKNTTDNIFILTGKATNLVYGDPDRIHQVVDNLISNAVKYSEPKSRVIVEIKNKEKYVQVNVRDYGVGIERKHHKDIFDRFYRVNDSGEATYPGLGIGLYISSEIIKRHNGKIWLESKIGEGSTFSFSLPW